jgi:2-polyprenyl-3-methyl-5-hydroxy-6-metoxy-1,4-benzoquinol methylase
MLAPGSLELSARPVYKQRVAYVDRCRLCAGPRIHAQFALDRYGLTVFRCDECTFQFVGDDLPDAAVEGLYSGEGLADYFIALGERHLRKFAPRLRELRRIGVSPGARVLDVGCGSGEFPALAKAAGYDAVGLDVSEPSIRAARRLHPEIDYRVGEASALAAAEPESFDVVTLWDVIEHVKYPHDVMTACAALVRPGGLVALGTPNGDSLYDRVGGAAYRAVRPLGTLMLMQRYSTWHLQIWTARTLSHLVRAHGLDVDFVRKHRELTATPSLYLRQQQFVRLANIARHADDLIEAALPIRNKLTLYARKPAPLIAVPGSAERPAPPVLVGDA